MKVLIVDDDKTSQKILSHIIGDTCEYECAATGEEAFTVEIWHEKKGKVKTVKSNKKLETIDVSGLDKGNYFLHIITPTVTYKEHILIE